MNHGNEDGIEKPARTGDPTERWKAHTADIEKHVKQTGNIPLSGGIRSGLPQFDSALGGHSGITILGGSPATGKTSLVIQTAITALVNDPHLCVILCSYESSSANDVFDYALSMVAGVDREKVVSGTLSEQERKRVAEARHLIETKVLPRLSLLTLDDHPVDERGWVRWSDKWRGAMNGLYEVHKYKRLLTVIDRIQKMPLPHMTCNTPSDIEPMIRRAESDPDKWQMDQISEAYRDMRKSGIETAFIVVCEVRKGEANRKRLDMNDLLGSVSLGYEPDRVILLERASEGHAADITRVTLRVVKVRRGEEFEIPLHFRFKQFRFEEFKPLIKLPTATVMPTSTTSATRITNKHVSKNLDPFAGT